MMMMKVVGEEDSWTETNPATPLSTDHCYTFKRGIRPKVDIIITECDKCDICDPNKYFL